MGHRICSMLHRAQNVFNVTWAQNVFNVTWGTECVQCYKDTEYVQCYMGHRICSMLHGAQNVFNVTWDTECVQCYMGHRMCSMLHGTQNVFNVTWGTECVQEGRSAVSCHVITNILIKKQRNFNLQTLILFWGYKKALNEVIRNNLWHICLTNDFHSAL